MLHRTSIGLDVHARGIAAAAFVPETGEVLRKSFGYDADVVASWAKALPQPARCVYESGPTGFDLKRKLDESGVECLVGAVSKMILGVLSVSVVTPAPVAVVSSIVTAVGACALPVAHAGVLVVAFLLVNSVFGKHIAQLAHTHGGAFLGRDIHSGLFEGLVGAVFRDAHARIVGSLALLGARAIAVRLAVAAKTIVALRGERGVAILVVAVDGHLHNGAPAGYGAHGAIEIACGVVEGAPHAGCLVKRPLTVVVERVRSHHDVETIQRELNRRIYVDSHIRHGS